MIGEANYASDYTDSYIYISYEGKLKLPIYPSFQYNLRDFYSHFTVQLLFFLQNILFGHFVC